MFKTWWWAVFLERDIRIYVPLAGAKPFVDNAHLSEGDKEKFAHLNAETILHLKD